MDNDNIVDADGKFEAKKREKYTSTASETCYQYAAIFLFMMHRHYGIDTEEELAFLNHMRDLTATFNNGEKLNALHTKLDGVIREIVEEIENVSWPEDTNNVTSLKERSDE